MTTTTQQTNKSGKVKVVAVECQFGWKFATFRKDGSLNRSLRSWSTKAAALRAGRREWKA